MTVPRRIYHAMLRTFEGQCERNHLAISASVKDSVNGPRGSVDSAVRRFLEMLHKRSRDSDDHPA